MIELEKSPNWMKTLISSLPTTQQFILYGNIHDFYPCYDSDYGYVTFSLSNFLAKHFDQLGYDGVLSFEPIKGFYLLYGDKDTLKTFGFSFENSNYMDIDNLNFAYKLIKKLLFSNEYAYVVIFNFASYLKELSFSKDSYVDFFFNLFRDSFNSTPINKNGSYFYNQITFLFRDLDDIPKWYHNTKIKYINIPKPDIEVRKTIISSIISEFEDYKNIFKEKKEKIINILAHLTEGMYGKEFLNILLEVQRCNSKNLIDFIQTKKLNTNNNPWLSFKAERLTNLREKLQRFSYICDNSSCDKIVNIIKSVYLNFSNIETDSFLDRPRSVMLFDGYHQEEQSKLLQLLSELIFKNRDSYLKIDMKRYLKTSDLENFLENLSFHINNFPYGIILFEDIQKANIDLLKLIFDIK